MGKASLATQALEHLASIDLIELCNEAKIEHCRATRDLSSCGRYVQHVLSSCGHASLCAECSQRCDACPICRTSVPNNGSRIRLRLYYKCIEAGLISKRCDERFQDKDVGSSHQMADIQRLYSLFDVALENNLVSLICHYVTDVCMDENAVSSDPVLAFLLDEVVVKDWCKQTFNSVIGDLQEKYRVRVEEMKSQLPLLQKSGMRLSGISNILEVMVSTFGEAFSGQLHDLHQLLENTLKAKQHLEIMVWCIQHDFLENAQSRYPHYTSWILCFHENKSAAVKRAWPEFSSCRADSSGSHSSTLFVEEAMSNLGIDEVYAEEREESCIFCLQDENSSSFFQSKMNQTNKNEAVAYYPFENVRAAADILFLHGTSDMVVAKHAIFLYYLFDRHWTRPDVEWRHLIDEFASSFSISRHLVLECLAFYLLDDHTDQALQEAIRLLPEIAGPETHPKIAQVLLERQRPDVALSVLRWAGHDGFSIYPKSDNDSLVNSSLNEAITGVRVRIECGLLTESFMYQRTHCLKIKELASMHSSSLGFSNNSKSASWIYHVEGLVTEICHLCIRRNLVDRMIELPWDSTEEKFLHKCLFHHASQNPASVCGSLLVVFYLQRYRYMEGYQLDRKLQHLEQNFLESANEEVVCRVKSINHWRAGLVEKSLELLPEVQRKQAHEKTDDASPSFFEDVQIPETDSTRMPSTPATILAPSSSKKSPLVFQKALGPFPSTKSTADGQTNFTGSFSNAQFESVKKTPSVLQNKLLSSLGNPVSWTNTSVGKVYSANPHDSGPSPMEEVTFGCGRERDAGQQYGSIGASVSTSALMMSRRDPKRTVPRVRQNGHLFGKTPARSSNYGNRAEKLQTLENGHNLMDTPHTNGFTKDLHLKTLHLKTSQSTMGSHWTRSFPEDATVGTLSSEKRDSPVENSSTRIASRWRSDESSEDEAEHAVDRHISGGTLFARRRPRISRR